MTDRVRLRTRMRGRNQITIPEALVREAGFAEGDTFVVELEQESGDTIRLRRVRRSYAGALRGVYADPEPYLEEERQSWE